MPRWYEYIDWLPSSGIWASTTPPVATVSGTGLVSAFSFGTSTISYTSPLGCVATAIVTVSAPPPPIVGLSTMCVGTVATFTDPAPGGSWSSSNPSVATINATGGVTALAPGITVIRYSLGGGCDATFTLTVSTPPSSITGSLLVCMGTTSPLSNAITGGTWTSSDPSICTITPTGGIVNGINLGTSVITYSISADCYATAVVTVSLPPSAITGPGSVCVGNIIFESNAMPGGIWRSSIPGIASIDSIYGIVTGVAIGVTAIDYTIGTCTVTRMISVTPPPATITSSQPNVCVGNTVNMYSSPPGGSWSSSIPADGTIDAVTGVFTGIGTGTTLISYSVTGCVTVIPYTVYPIPDPIAGGNTTCLMSAPVLPLSDAMPYGIWSSSNTAVATISTAGVVTSLAGGTTTITYTSTLGGGCIATEVLTVNVCKPGNTIRENSSEQGAITEFDVYPNPSKGLLTIATAYTGTFFLYDLEGKELLQNQVEAGYNKIDLSDKLATGIYICKFIDVKGGIRTVRLVFERN